MNFRLICQEGIIKDQEFAITDSLEIGRSKGDVQLKDPKCSKLHAKITKDSKGLFRIEDLDSSHGTYVNGTKITKSTPLKAGDLIGIGKTVLSFVEAAVTPVIAAPGLSPETAADVIPKDIPKELPKEVVPEKKTWRDLVAESLENFEREPAVPAAPATRPTPFSAPVVLDFAQGLQSGQTLVFGFGPRSVGLHCNEGLLIDGSGGHAPPVAFELHPSTTSLCELRAVADDIQVNGQTVKVQNLKGGDRISFGKTILVVREPESSEV